MARWLRAMSIGAAGFALGCGAAAPVAESATSGQVTFVSGADGARLQLSSVAEMAKRADVVVMGEVHGHALGLDAAADLFAELSVVDSAALSLEFFERDEQSVLDDYLSGRLDAASFLKASQRSEANYPPGHRRMVELARQQHHAVYAANAPRKYAKIARAEGFDALRALPEEEQALFAIPERVPEGAYRTRFEALMGGDDAHGGDVDLDGLFRAQSLWDETMAATIAGALTKGHRPVFHVVGRFHVDHEGGLVQQLRRSRPGSEVLTVSTIDRWFTSLDQDDRGRADVLVYVGPGEA